METPTTAARAACRAPRRSVVAASGLLVICAAPFAGAATGDNLREGVRNGTTTKETEIVSNIRSTNALKGGYSTRQSNLSTDGGGAIYGCRSKAGGSAAKPTPQNPCVRANNLSTGYAFEFNAANGDTAGLISVGPGGDRKKPFITNATGVATGLNADRVDGVDAAQIIAAARDEDGPRRRHGRRQVDSADLQAALRAGASDADAVAETPRRRRHGGVDARRPPAASTRSLFTGDLSKCALVGDGDRRRRSARSPRRPAVAAGNTTVTVRTVDVRRPAPPTARSTLAVSC